MGLYSKDTTGDQIRRQQKKTQAAIEAGQQSIDKAFSGFNEGFYDQRAQDYTNYAMPQLEQQYLGARSNARGSLANAGLLNSSIANNAMTGLRKTLDADQQAVVDSGIAQAQALRERISAEKTNLYSQLAASANPSVASQGALQSAAQFTAPSVFSPLVNYFGNGGTTTYGGYSVGSLLNALSTNRNNPASYSVGGDSSYIVS